MATGSLDKDDDSAASCGRCFLSSALIFSRRELAENPLTRDAQIQWLEYLLRSVNMFILLNFNKLIIYFLGLYIFICTNSDISNMWWISKLVKVNFVRIVDYRPQFLYNFHFC